MPEKLCVFISYKRENQPFAEHLWETLRTWGYETWLDVKNIESGISPETTGWIDAIHKGLKRSHVLIGVVTPESLNSERVKEEWNWAKLANRRILLLRLNPFNMQDMPPPFATANYIDLVANEQSGINQLRDVLQNIHRERDQLKAEITPPAPPSPAVNKPKTIPQYLLEQPAHRRYTPWPLTLRVLGILGLPVSFLWLVSQPDFEPLLAFFGAIGSLLASLVGKDDSESDLKRFSKLTDFEQMRKRVYQYWVQGVMQTALKEVENVGIALEMQPEAVVRDTRKNVGDIALPNDSRHVRQVYNTFNSFLILGDPGAGKTIMLLQLAESLILDAPPTHTRAIPLVLNLSSWALHPQPLENWLEEEVWRTYRVRGNRVRGWLQNKQLILLLDGLDEVKEEQRAACVTVINTFRSAYAFVPLVVCSRIKDYERLGETKLELSGAILLEALSQAQIDQYLSDPSLAHLKRVIASDTVLQTMATTPFLLNTMIYAYRHEAEAALRGFDTEAQRREHLFNTYVQRRLDDDRFPYKFQPTITYLEWLATKMQAYVQTVFHLEDIQPDWMADDPLYQRVVNALRVTYAVILTLVYALVGYRMGGVIGLLAWGAGGALVGVVIAYVQQFRFILPDKIEFELNREDHKFLLYVITAPALGLILIQILTAFMAELLALVLVSAIAGVLLFIRFARDNGNRWQENAQLIAGFVASALGVGGIAWSISHILQGEIWIEAVIVSVIVSAVFLHPFVFKAQSDTTLPHQQTTLRRVLLVSTLMGFTFGLIGLLLNIGAILGIAAALTYAGLFNAVTLLYIPVVWLRLYQRKRLPVRPLPFLDALSERQILRQMGGGYIFIHRYLLENFARVDEIFILIDQLMTDNVKAHEKAAAALVNIGQPAVRLLRETLEKRTLSPAQKNRLYHPLDTLQPRAGIGLRADGIPDIVWCNIPAGEFIFGDDEKSKYPDYALPADRQILSLAAFRISRYPVTYKQFQAFIDAPDGFHDSRWWEGLAASDIHKSSPDDQRFKFWNHPRNNVSWYDAIAFCRWLSFKLTGKIYRLDEVEQWPVRLPTELEWERAARGTDGRVYPYGNDFDAARGNTRETRISQTSAVGMFPDGASPDGVLDMSGNVWQWCLTDYRNPAPETAGEDLRTDARRVLRGGSWDNGRGLARATGRIDLDPNYRYFDDGFRVVLRPPSLDH